MDPILSNLRVVELVNPYEQWHDAFVRELFEKTTTLKFEGYRQKYPEGVIPTDAVIIIVHSRLLPYLRKQGTRDL